MDAVTFVKERSRMCESNITCATCPAYYKQCGSSGANTTEEAKAIVDVVEKWVKENPITTNRAELNRMLANSFVLVNGLYYDNDGNLMLSREWLNKEYKKPEVLNE